jgi:hypothetical protein
MQPSTKYWLIWIVAYLVVAVSPFVLNTGFVVVFALSAVFGFFIGTWWAPTLATVYPVLFLAFLPLGGSVETDSPALGALILALPAVGSLTLGVGLRKLWGRWQAGVGVTR